MKEFNLSDWELVDHTFPKFRVKEFIKNLKEEMFKSWQENKWSYQLIKYKIDKLAGKELI